MQRLFLILIAMGALSWALRHYHDEAVAQSAPMAPTVSSQTAPGTSSDTRTAKAPPLVIAHGEEVTLSRYVTPGRWTVFDFYSDYCPPCRALRPELEKLHANRADVCLVIVDINRPGVRGIDFDSPVASQYGIHMIPHLKVYDPKGALYAEDSDTDQPGHRLVYQWMAGH